MKQTPNPAWRTPAGEEGISRDLLMVRAALQALPKVPCPTGFEFRLQRRIEGHTGRERSSSRIWTWNWAGAGLGFAAAFVIAVFVFNLNTVTPTQAPIAAGEQTSPTATMKAAGENPAQPVEVESVTPNQQLADEQTTTTSVAKDSQAVKQPTLLPENLYHTVGGNDR
ncbi:MAG: hypothetical protein ACOZB3_09700 [Calditrichota bacterium]